MLEQLPGVDAAVVVLVRRLAAQPLNKLVREYGATPVAADPATLVHVRRRDHDQVRHGANGFVKVAQLAHEAVVEDAEVPVGRHLGGLEEQDLVLLRRQLLQPIEDVVETQHFRQVHAIPLVALFAGRVQGNIGRQKIGPLAVRATVQREEDNDRLLLEVAEVVIPDISRAVLLRFLVDAELIGAPEEVGVGIAGKLPHVLQALPAKDVGRDEEVVLIAGADEDQAGGLGRQHPEAGPDEQCREQ